MRASVAPRPPAVPVIAPTGGRWHRNGRCRNLDFFALSVSGLTCQAQVLGPFAAAAASVDDDSVDRPVTSSIFGDGARLLDASSNGPTGVFGDDRPDVRIPGGEQGAGLDVLAVVDHAASRRTAAWRVRARGPFHPITTSPGTRATRRPARPCSVMVRTVVRLEAGTGPCCAGRWRAARLARAAPPTWKVRMVSWVPGSPIDCAAITPPPRRC